MRVSPSDPSLSHCTSSAAASTVAGSRHRNSARTRTALIRCMGAPPVFGSAALYCPASCRAIVVSPWELFQFLGIQLLQVLLAGGQHRVAQVAAARDPLAFRGLVVTVVTTEASRRIFAAADGRMAAVVRIGIPAHVHVREDVPAVDVAQGVGRGFYGRRLLDRDLGIVVPVESP